MIKRLLVTAIWSLGILGTVAGAQDILPQDPTPMTAASVVAANEVPVRLRPGARIALPVLIQAGPETEEGPALWLVTAFPHLTVKLEIVPRLAGSRETTVEVANRGHRTIIIRPGNLIGQAALIRIVPVCPPDTRTCQ